MTNGSGDDKKNISPDLSSVINKGKSLSLNQEAKNGNELLQSAPNNKNLENYTKTILLNNRFTAENTQESNKKIYSPKYGNLTHKQLAQIGTSLSLRASQELNSTKKQNTSSAEVELQSVLPSGNQLSITKVDNIVLETQDVLNNLSLEEISDSELIKFNKSWGALNNTYDRFTGITAYGMIALSITLMSSVIAIFESLGALISLLDTTYNKKENNRYILGKSSSAYTNTSIFNVNALLGVRPTVKPLGESIKAGVLIFFGIKSNSIMSAIESGLKQSIAAPGHTVVMSRAIIRAFSILFDSGEKIFDSPNIASGVKNLVSMIEVLRNSKIISAINVFATLGDIALSVNSDENSYTTFNDKKPYTSIERNRLNDSLKLSWANNRSPAYYLLPNSIAGLQSISKDTLDSFQSGMGLLEKEARIKYNLKTNDYSVNNGNRISIKCGKQISYIN